MALSRAPVPGPQSRTSGVTTQPPGVLKTTAAQAVYAKLLRAVACFGAFEVEEKQTSVHLIRGRAFAGVSPRVDGIILSLVFDVPLEHARVRKLERLSARRFHAEIKLATPGEVDAELVGWVKRAYALAAPDRPARPVIPGPRTRTPPRP